MPGGGGPRAAREIRRLSPGTRIVALSAHDDSGSVFQMLRAGCVSYVVKGATFEEIKDALVSAARGESIP
jgi:DNA-binding NarL/FixJ family response regulator